jgi:hypothetical protein
MSYPVYTVYAGDVLPIFFDSFDGGTGASITMTGLAVTDIEIYKDGSTTQRASDAGYTLLDTDGIDFDSITGIHGFSIDTGDNTDAGFFAVGSWFHVVVSSITIDGQTVSFVAASFRIVAAEAIAGVPVVDVKAISGDTDSADNCELDYDGTGYAGGTIVKKADVTKISGDADAADNCELMFDGTGYAGGTIQIKSDATLNATQGSYAPAKAGDKMDLVDAPGATGLAAVADAILLRDWTAIVASPPARCLLNAARALRNKFLAATGAAGYKVKKEDDSTDAWTGVLTVDDDGNITAMDPD